MSKRHENAIGIQKGACNPSGIANAIVEACKEARDEGVPPSQCPAVQLMVHQLASVMGVDLFFSASGGHHYWLEAVKACEEKGGVKLA
jgi:hypothetical protein